MRKSALAVAPAIAAALAGCNLAPPYLRPPAPVPEVLPQGGVYPPAASDAPDVTRIGWRDLFTEPRLRGVIALGLENNRDLRIAAANVLAARAVYRIRRADRLPTITAGGSATFTNNFGATPAADVDIYSVDLGTAAFEIDLFGRVRNLSRAALEQYFATEEAQRAARIGLISEIAVAWLSLGADLDQIALSRETLRAYEQTRSLTEAQFHHGVASELELRQADTQFQAARNDIAVLETRIARDRNAIDLLAGTPVPAELLPSGLTVEGATRPELPAGLSSDVLLRRPDVLQAEHQLVAEHANIGAARAAMFPSISLTGTLGTLSSGLAGLFGNGSFAYSVAPSASLPIFDFGRRRANVRLAEANRQAALANYERTIQVAFREVADALAQRGTIGEQLSAQVARAESAQIAARLADARYRVGVDSFLVALDARRTAYAAQQQLVSTRLAREANLVELYRSLGGGLN